MEQETQSLGNFWISLCKFKRSNREIFVGLTVSHRKRIIKYTCETVKGKYAYIMVVAIYHTRDVSGMEHHGESLETSW